VWLLALIAALLRCLSAWLLRPLPPTALGD
jgi:hypothetical protein